MSAKAKAPARPAVVPLVEEPNSGPWQTPPGNVEECQRRIEVLSNRLNQYIQFMGKVATMNGISGEAKLRALLAFYERLVVAASQLGRIHDGFQLE